MKYESKDSHIIIAEKLNLIKKINDGNDLFFLPKGYKIKKKLIDLYIRFSMKNNFFLIDTQGKKIEDCCEYLNFNEEKIFSHIRDKTRAVIDDNINDLFLSKTFTYSEEIIIFNENNYYKIASFLKYIYEFFKIFDLRVDVQFFYNDMLEFLLKDAFKNYNLTSFKNAKHPKINFVLKDRLNRNWVISSVLFINSNKKSLLVRSSLVVSFERLMAILLEYHNKNIFDLIKKWDY